MAVRKGVAAKTAAKKPAPKAKVAKVQESEGRATATALLDPKSAEFKAISERYQNWVKKWQDDGVAFIIKNLHRMLGHNKGLFIYSTTVGTFEVGQKSSSGKSFHVEFSSEDPAEAWAYYRGERSGNYGVEKPAKKAAPTKKAAPKKAAAAPAPKKAAAKKAAPKPKPRTKRAASLDVDEDLDDLLD